MNYIEVRAGYELREVPEAGDSAAKEEERQNINIVQL